MEAGVGPLGAVGGVGDVEFCDGDGVDFVGGFGDGAFDGLFVVVGENRGHGEGGLRRLSRPRGGVLGIARVFGLVLSGGLVFTACS